MEAVDIVHKEEMARVAKMKEVREVRRRYAHIKVGRADGSYKRTLLEHATGGKAWKEIVEKLETLALLLTAIFGNPIFTIHDRPWQRASISDEISRRSRYGQANLRHLFPS